MIFDSIYNGKVANFAFKYVSSFNLMFYRVYLARNNDTGMECALKIIKAEYFSSSEIDEIQTEVNVMKTLCHPNISKLIEAGESVQAVQNDGTTEEVFAIAMEL